MATFKTTFIRKQVSTRTIVAKTKVEAAQQVWKIEEEDAPETEDCKFVEETTLEFSDEPDSLSTFEKRVKIYYTAFQWLLNNQETISKYESFDHPEYGGMPKILHKKFSGDFMDFLCFNWPAIKEAKTISQLCDLIFL